MANLSCIRDAGGFLLNVDHCGAGRKPLRVYMDGCFDMMHYGHANAMRQAKALGDELVIGLIPDSEILMAKGPPVMNDAERKTMVESVKWVDEVIEGAALPILVPQTSMLLYIAASGAYHLPNERLPACL